MSRTIPAVALALGLAATGAAQADDTPAKQLFGAARTPAAMEVRSIGSYARGCLAGAIALPVNGPSWQVMRLSRNRNWGTPLLVDFLERLATAAPKVGWNGLLVGDIAQPRGGPMLTGHASHQIGLDADIWLTPMPDRTLTVEERETMSATSMLGPDGKSVDPKIFGKRQLAILKLAASQPEVARIFVNPAIKKALCERASGDRGWLRTVRPWWGHDFHFHVRLQCPASDPACKPQDPPPPGDGCGAELDGWFKPPEEPTKPAKPAKPKPPLALKDLPPACSQVLLAP
ncbi:penicillin-insensitive murein endopeptidase [Oharaeibacter diazotrophicus]|uniref:Penicillin-insensitive murein endopeptidase n=1 Tax=Oharaeibacter diazotrophicus TaxID=1920512 RepID=A0A4R6RF74_9HYPH|nr:penicillin-insensitive murein endopeptidase [Oharaeibacter diazotrophicus]TDP85011.1 penicillin-insensitive murein endopeptidase [Oharaeibacter diazotrophicus]BBE73981.1 penicillin-insensitive murein endopeptidase precursor [Pleomorphomonas sp. SM30]